MYVASWLGAFTSLSQTRPASGIVVPSSPTMAQVEVPTCAICQQDLNEDEEIVTWLCCHRYHQYCTTQYMRVKGGNCDDVPCPQCHMTTRQAIALQNPLVDHPEQDFPRDPPSITPPSSPPPTDVVSPASPPASPPSPDGGPLVIPPSVAADAKATSVMKQPPAVPPKAAEAKVQLGKGKAKGQRSGKA